MNLLAIETSCDETAAAVLRDGRELLSSVIFSQGEIHGPFGGIVPELACRRHIQVISPLVRGALEKAGLSLSELDAVAVTAGPGLIGALLVGVSFAKGLAYGLGIPLVAVNHLEGHLWAVSLNEEAVPPFVALVVSGGHTQIYHVRGLGDYEILGGTLDDAAGEAFDKVARVLGLGFPGGPVIERAALQGDPAKYPLPRGLDSRQTLDFSFSGLKTAVIRQVRKAYPDLAMGDSLEKIPPSETKDRFVADMAAGFQESVVGALVERTTSAAVAAGVSTIVLSGGVASNQRLRSRLVEMAQPHGIRVLVPEPVYCTDNAAMIAWVGYRYFQRGEFARWDLNPRARMPIGYGKGSRT